MRRIPDFLRHPRELALLCLIEFLERLSFYGMRAILVLFMTAPAAGGGLGLSDGNAVAVYSLYIAAAYLTSLAGGLFADRWLGARRTLYAGAALCAVGHGVLALSSSGLIAGGLRTRPQLWFLGLTFIAFGAGLFKPNILVLVGSVYDRTDSRRDHAFSLFYMTVNAGALGGGLLCGWIAMRRG